MPFGYDHIHAIWSMPPGDCDYSKRWGIVKKHFTQHWLALGGVEQPVTEARRHNRRRGVYPKGTSGNGVFGNIRCATNGIIKIISITCISIRLNTAWRIRFPTGLIRRFIIGSIKAFILTIGLAVLQLTSSPAMPNLMVNKRRVRTAYHFETNLVS
jgi:hypothetical protein